MTSTYSQSPNTLCYQSRAEETKKYEAVSYKELTNMNAYILEYVQKMSLSFA